MKAKGRPSGTRSAETPGLLFNMSEARIRLGLSQAEAGALIGKSPSHFGKIERGIIGLDARHALTLCQRLRLPLIKLLETRQ